MVNDTVYNDIIEIINKDVDGLNLSSIGSEMLLLALVNLEDSMTSLIFKEMGVTTSDIKKTINESCILRKKTKYTSKFYEIIDRSQELQKKFDYVYDEGYLHSLLMTNDTVAKDILKRMNIDEDQIMDELEHAREFLERESHILVNITKLAKTNKLPQFIGRENYIDRIDRILSKKQKNNAMLIGAAGVGKTGLVEGLAQYYAKEYPETIIYRLDLGTIIAGTRYRGDLEERLLEAIDEIKANNAIVFIDEIHNILTQTSNEASMDIANILKPVLSRSEIKCIGATTTEEYYKFIYRDKALVRRFQNIFVDEVNDDECLDILRGIKSEYEVYHRIEYPDEILKFIINISKLITNKKMPDKVIDILDESGLVANRSGQKSVNKDIIIDLVFESISLDRKAILNNISTTTEFPDLCIYIEKYLNLENNKIIACVQTNTNQHVLNWFKEIFNAKPEVILEIDLKDFVDNHYASNLIGSPSGYVGYENGGILTEHLLANPFSIVLLKNYDNANGIVKGIIKRAISTGVIIDNKRRTISLQNSVFILEVKAEQVKVGFLNNKVDKKIEDFINVVYNI